MLTASWGKPECAFSKHLWQFKITETKGVGEEEWQRRNLKLPKGHKCKTSQGSGDKMPARDGCPPTNSREPKYRQHMHNKVKPECIDTTERMN